ncbi:hypothetical protein [Comamonas testosteroni]|nr:hypothetical protein [Comamonas testosteroni]
MSIYASWRTEKSILQIISRDFDDQEKERWSADERALEQYAQGGNPFKDPVDRTKASSAPFAINVTWVLGYSGRAHALAMKSLFSSKSGDWLLQYRTFTAVQFWRSTLDHHVLRFDLSFSHAMESISDCLYLGWLDKAELLVKEVHAAYSAKRFRGVTGGYSQTLYHFLLRVCFDWCQFKFDGWGIGYHGEVIDPYVPGECLGEPVLNELFAHWKDSDLSGMQGELQWLCDYYTHRTARKDGTEFGNDLLHTRFPALVLAWFRLRESLGLSNPVIDHPLMRPHYAWLPPPQPFYTDDLLDGVIARLRREELPDLGITPAQVAPRVLPEEPKQGFLARLLGRKS